MPRLSRKSIETPFLHVMTQGIEKRFIFNDPKDIAVYINLMYKFKNEYDINIVSYCIMNNHSHMLLEIKNLDKLSSYIHRLNGTYGEYYNKKNNRVGYVFRDRYKAEGIYGEKHFYNCINYIYNNPVMAGICKRPEDYPYSNYRKIELATNELVNFIDVGEDRDILCKKIIKDFLVNNNVELGTLKKEKENLRKIVRILRDRYNFPYKKIATELKINKTSIYRIYNRK